MSGRLVAFKTAAEAISGPLTDFQIKALLSRREAPLHPQWLEFLAVTRETLDTSRHFVDPALY
jgi:hypothetical protein